MRARASVALVALLAVGAVAGGVRRRSVRLLDPGDEGSAEHALRRAFGAERVVESGNAIEEIAAGRSPAPSWLEDARQGRTVGAGGGEDGAETALLEMGATAKGGEHGQCEMCMFAIHQSQFGRLPSCGASSTATYSSWMCVQVVRSMLRFARDVMDALKHGCFHYDKLGGWTTEKPCSAHAICGRLTNVYDLKQETLCPADPSYAFKHRVADPAPKVYNPLLPYAIKWYKDLNASSVAQNAESGFPL